MLITHSRFRATCFIRNFYNSNEMEYAFGLLLNILLVISTGRTIDILVAATLRTRSFL